MLLKIDIYGQFKLKKRNIIEANDNKWKKANFNKHLNYHLPKPADNTMLKLNFYFCQYIHY